MERERERVSKNSTYTCIYIDVQYSIVYELQYTFNACGLYLKYNCENTYVYYSVHYT